MCLEAGALLESLKHSMLRVMTTKIDNSAQALVEGAHGDLRLLLGQLQMIRLSAASMQYDDIKRQARNAKVRAVKYPVKDSRHKREVTSANLKLNLSAKPAQLLIGHVAGPAWRIQSQHVDINTAHSCETRGVNTHNRWLSSASHAQTIPGRNSKPLRGC